MTPLQKVLRNFPDRPITPADRKRIDRLVVKYRADRRRKRIAKLRIQNPVAAPPATAENMEPDASTPMAVTKHGI